MRRRGKTKYFLVIFLCFFIFVYGFIKINITKPEILRNRSEFTIDLKLKPVDFRIETKGYVFYVNNKVIINIKEKCVSAYNEIFSK